MKFNKEYLSIAVLYLFVFLYIILDNKPGLTILFVLMAASYHFYITIKVHNVLESDKETSVSVLETKLEKTRREREEAYKRFISLSTTLGSGVLLVDEEGIIKLVNKDMIDFFDCDFNDIDYQKVNDIEPLYKFINEAYLIENRLRRQIKYKKKYYDLISNPLFDKDMFMGTLILVHDITQLTNAEKFQKRFTADVSHELRTPLSAIKGFSEILSRDKNINLEEHDEFVDLINKEANRMEIILNDLLIISKMDRLDYELTLTEKDVLDLIKENVSVIKKQAKDKGLDISIDVESKILYLDVTKMTQVILNLLKNAINYTDKGFVKVTGYQKDEDYILKIEDSGIGIKEQDYQKIFKRFYRVDKARSRDTGGSGLGLSISKNVVKKHGGKISVSSVVDKGTTFTIKLPVTK